MTTIRVAPLAFKPSRLNGLSRNLLLSHYENNYGGDVRRLNFIERQLAEQDPAAVPGSLPDGLKREALIATNSVILHEVYFDGLGGPGGDPTGAIGAALERDFGSIPTWRREFTVIGKALAGSPGWVVLAYSSRLGRLVNYRAADDAHSLAGAVPVLALDMHEHAYHLDFGADAGAYVDTVMRNIAWERVAGRHAAAAAEPAAVPPRNVPQGDSVDVEELRAMLARGRAMTIIDARLADDFADGRDVIATATHRDPEQVAEWASSLPRHGPVFVYCAYGFEVSWDTAAALQRAGLDARTVRGGIAAWHAIDGPTEPKA